MEQIRQDHQNLQKAIEQFRLRLNESEKQKRSLESDKKALEVQNNEIQSEKKVKNFFLLFSFFKRFFIQL